MGRYQLFVIPAIMVVCINAMETRFALCDQQIQKASEMLKNFDQLEWEIIDPIQTQQIAIDRRNEISALLQRYKPSFVQDYLEELRSNFAKVRQQDPSFDDKRVYFYLGYSSNEEGIKASYEDAKKKVEALKQKAEQENNEKELLLMRQIGFIMGNPVTKIHYDAYLNDNLQSLCELSIKSTKREKELEAEMAELEQQIERSKLVEAEKKDRIRRIESKKKELAELEKKLTGDKRKYRENPGDISLLDIQTLQEQVQKILDGIASLEGKR